MSKKLKDRPDFATFVWFAGSNFFRIKKDAYFQCSKAGDTYSVSYKKYSFLWFIWIVLHIVSDMCCIVGASQTVVYVRDTAGSITTGAFIGIVIGFVFVDFLIAFIYFVVCYFNINFDHVQQQVASKENACELTGTEDESLSE